MPLPRLLKRVKGKKKPQAPLTEDCPEQSSIVGQAANGEMHHLTPRGEALAGYQVTISTKSAGELGF